MDRRQLLRATGLLLVQAKAPLAWAVMQEQRASSQVIDPALAQQMQKKIEGYDQTFADDIIIGENKFAFLKQTFKRLSQVQQHFGFAKFNLMSFDEVLKLSAQTPEVGAFSQAEVQFMEEMFFFDAKRYGFYGEKVTLNLSNRLNERDIIKVPGSGHYIFRGKPLNLYHSIVKDVGADVILTSGIRNVVKQFHLFLAKAVQCQGNLSMASRSLAPPGHSYHGISDFDVGKPGWGSKNFSEQFAQSDVFRRLTDLGYVDIRYTKTNNFGVRFEPWHIMVT